MDKQSLKEALIKLAQRPGLFIGTNRFDYMQLFYYGWDAFSQIHVYRWMSDYDIQRWLFLKESVSIYRAASIDGWTLMQRCYGNRQEAIDQFKSMLDEIELSSRDEYNFMDTVSRHIRQVYLLYKWGNIDRQEAEFNSKVSADYYPVNDMIRDAIGNVSHSYESIIPIIARMISEQYSDLWIYLHYERYFLCIKFLYHSEKEGWVENIALAHQQDYYRNLVVLHAYASLIQNEEHQNHILTLRHNDGAVTIDCEETIDEWYGIFNNDIDISDCDKNPFNKSYAEWKRKILSGLTMRNA
jgi:hypothetical protein